jgi:hypothetical protein
MIEGDFRQVVKGIAPALFNYRACIGNAIYGFVIEFMMLSIPKISELDYLPCGIGGTVNLPFAQLIRAK